MLLDRRRGIDRLRCEQSGTRGSDSDGSGAAGWEIMAAFMLVYCLITVPLQLSFWNSELPCYVAPTLHFDMVTDVFFLVRPLPPPLFFMFL